MDISMLLDQLSRVTDENGRIKRYSIRDKFVLAALDKKRLSRARTSNSPNKNSDSRRNKPRKTKTR